ncbi:type I methionyl aminopeptidase [Rickettsiales bacterium LUAb2]
MNYQYISYNNEQIPIYTTEDIKKIKKAGLLAYKVLEFIKPFIKEGVSTLYLNDLCHEFILKHGATPAPLNYNGYPKATCISLNHVVCHGIPSENQILKSTDILNIDITVKLNGFYGDTSAMFVLGNQSIKANHLINTTFECLQSAIDLVKPNAYLGDIGAKISEIAHKNGFSVVEDFCGHGIGHVFHQAPQVLHFGKANTGVKLQTGMVFTIEPMLNAGKKDVKVLGDGWTAVTKDKSLSAQFEHTIAVTDSGYEILTLP